MINTVTFVDFMYFLELLLQASEETLHSSNEEEDPFHGMEPYLVRRLSCRNIQLPPLAFRQLEQADLKSESENIQRPTSLPLKILPLIAITSADSSGWVPSRCHFPILYFRCDCYLWSFEFLWLIAWFEWENNGVSRVKKKRDEFLRWYIYICRRRHFSEIVLQRRAENVLVNANKHLQKGSCTWKINIGHMWLDRKNFNKWELMDKLPCSDTWLETIGNVHWCKMNLASRIDCIVMRIKRNMQWYSWV